VVEALLQNYLIPQKNHNNQAYLFDCADNNLQ
jgi:hypothetical protein